MENSVSPFPIVSDSWSVKQNCVAEQTEVWYLDQNQNVSANYNGAPSDSSQYFDRCNQKNTNLDQPISSTSQNFSNGPVSKELIMHLTDLWRKQASVEDWEAYLYSTTWNPVEHVMQKQLNVRVNHSIPSHPTPPTTPRINHQAHISFVHSPDGVLEPTIKRKRKRTAFTTEQIEALESTFYKRPYVSREERQVLSEKLKVSDKAVKVWFQNKRLKVKKERQEMEESAQEMIEVENGMPIGYVDANAQVSKDNEYGYTVLNDTSTIDDIVNVIDQMLPNNIVVDTSVKTTEIVSTESLNNQNFYEPISPANTSEEEQDDFIRSLVGFEPVVNRTNASIQNLFELHECSNSQS